MHCIIMHIIYYSTILYSLQGDETTYYDDDDDDNTAPFEPPPELPPPPPQLVLTSTVKGAVPANLELSKQPEFNLGEIVYNSPVNKILWSYWVHINCDNCFKDMLHLRPNLNVHLRNQQFRWR